MKYCTQCGNELPLKTKFCTNCGKTLEGKRVPYGSISNRRKVMGILVSVAIVLFLTHLWVENIIDPYKRIEKLDDRMMADDAHGFFEHVSLEKDGIVNKEEYLQYIREGDWDFVIDQIIQVIEHSDKDSEVVMGWDGREVLKVEKRKWLLGFYETYNIQGIHKNLHLKTNVAPLSITINDGKEMNISEEDEYRDIAVVYPGSHTIRWKGENEFGEFVDEEEMSVSLFEGGSPEVKMEVDLDTFTLKSNQMDAALFYNGEDTGYLLKDFAELGPFPSESSSILHAEIQDAEGNVLRTEAIQPEQLSSDSMSFIFEVEKSDEEKELENAEEKPIEEIDLNDVPEEELIDQAEQHVLHFREDYEKALNTEDFTLVAFYLGEGSEAAIELEEYMEDVRGNGYHFDFQENVIDDSQKVRDDLYKVTTRETFTFTDQGGMDTDYERYKEYVIYFSSHGFKIVEIHINDTKRNQRSSIHQK
ncbi:TcaA NTF2-like domain-containing protein [Halobacillus faecis]